MADKKISQLTAATTPLAGTETLPIVQGTATVKVPVNNLFETASSTKTGLLSSTDWSTFNGKQPAGSYALTTGTLAQFASTTSAQLAGVISDETGSGVLVFGTSPTIATPTLTGDVTLSTGNLVIGTSGKGIDFSATAGTGTSELLADYEEGTWTPAISWLGATSSEGTYTKVGRQVTVRGTLTGPALSFGVTAIIVDNLPFAVANQVSGCCVDGGNSNGAFVTAGLSYIIGASLFTPAVTSMVFTVTYFV